MNKKDDKNLIAERLKKILLMGLFAIFIPTVVQACIFSYEPYSLVDDYDLAFSAEAQKCEILDNAEYTELKVRRVWKGTDQKSYKVKNSCDRFQAGNGYLLVANYAAEEGVIVVPEHSNCTHPTRSFGLLLENKINEIVNFYYVLGIFDAANFLFKEPVDFYMGERPALHDFRPIWFLDKHHYNHYLICGAVLGFLGGVAGMFIWLVRRIKRRLKKQ